MKDLGIVRESLREFHALPHAFAVGADLLVRGVPSGSTVRQRAFRPLARFAYR
jgi:hypothetical protein